MKFDMAQIRRFGSLELLARQLVEGFITGIHRSPYHGFSVEFAEHKQYNFGESIRHVDWKVYGRTEKLYTKRYEEETNLRCMIVLDTSSSMYYPKPGFEKLGFSITAAACLAYLLQRQRDAIGLCTFSDHIRYKSAIRSTPAHLQSILQELGRLTDQPPQLEKTSSAQVLHEVADLMKRRALIVIFSDLFESSQNQEALFSALQHLKHNKHEVIVFHTTDFKTERDFDFEDRPYEFVDSETGERVKLRPSDFRDMYREAMGSFFHELKLRCAQYKISLVEADVAQGMDQILLPFLVKRNRMH
jgi:uncharacterized protein (DUF58 family)